LPVTPPPVTTPPLPGGGGTTGGSTCVAGICVGAGKTSRAGAYDMNLAALMLGGLA
jgi:hypothetical protein